MAGMIVRVILLRQIRNFVLKTFWDFVLKMFSDPGKIPGIFSRNYFVKLVYGSQEIKKKNIGICPDFSKCFIEFFRIPRFLSCPVFADLQDILLFP